MTPTNRPTAYDLLIAAIEKHLPGDDREDARRELADLAYQVQQDADAARARTEAIELHVDTALMHLDDMTRFGWPDRLDDAYRELAAVA